MKNVKPRKMRTIVATVSSYIEGTSGQLTHDTFEFQATSKRGYKRKALDRYNESQINPRLVHSIWLQDYYEMVDGEKKYLK